MARADAGAEVTHGERGAERSPDEAAEAASGGRCRAVRSVGDSGRTSLARPPGAAIIPPALHTRMPLFAYRRTMIIVFAY